MIAVLEPKQNEISVIAQNIDNGLQAFEDRKLELIELKKEATGLKITSIDDKDSIQQVSTIRKKLKSARVEIEKEGKSMRDPLTRFSKLISEKEKELVAIIEPTEKELLVQEKWVDDERDKIKQEIIDMRLNVLSFTDKSFDRVYIGSLDDKDFAILLDRNFIEHEKEQAEKAEAERLRKEEAAKLKSEREELEKLRTEQAKSQAIIEENNERIRKEQEAKEAAIRAEQQKIEAEKKAAEMERQRIEQEKQRAIELEQARKDAAEKARLQAIEDARIEAENKEKELQEAKAKAIREEALRPDKEKLESFANRIGSLIDFQVNDEKAQHILGDVQVMIGKIQTHILNKIKEL